MAGRESAGSVYITIDADPSPLLAKYQQAEAQSRAAGQRIASGLGQGLGSAKQIVDQFGNAISSGIVVPVEKADSEIKTLTIAVIALTESLDTKGTPALRRMGQAAHGTVSEIQATSGALRVLEGNGGLRAAERFIATTIGIGGALQTIFPIVGAIAFGELLEKTAGRFFGVSESEKKAAEDAKTVTGEIKNLDREVETLRVRFETMRNGAQAGLTAELKSAGDQIREAATALQDAQDKLHGGVRQTVGGRQIIVPAHTSSIQRTPEAGAAEIAGQQLEKAQLEALTKSAELDKKRQEEIKAAAALERTAFKEKYDNQLADMRANHEVTKSEELQFKQRELADARTHGSALAAVATEVNREVGTLSQEVRKEKYEESRALGIAQVEYASRLRKEAIAGLEADGRLMTAAVEVITKEMDREAASRQKSADVQDRAGRQARQFLDVQASGQGEKQKIQAEIAYGAQVVHSRQQELQYAIQLQNIQAAALRLKVEAANADVADAEAALKMNPSADQLLKLQQALTEQKKAQLAVDNQQLSAQLQMQTLQQKTSLSGQIRSAVGTGPATILDARNQVVAQGMATAVDGISGALGRAVQGGQKLGQIFSQLGRSILGSVVQGIAKIGLQMAVTAVAGKALGSAVAVAEVTSAAAVGAANAAAATAAIPIIGPALAPAAAAATFAEIMAFAPLASYDKGGMIPEDQLAMVHKGEFVLTADQMAGRSALPSLPIGGSVNSGGFTTASQVSNSSSQNQSNIFHLHGIRNVEDFARRLPNVLKSRAPNFSPASR